MELLLISVAALLTSALTLFSGFGLGTLLLPVFALFFPVEIAVTLTAVVHLLNNIFKFGLMMKFVDVKIAAVFGIPALIAAYLGAKLLILLADFPPIATYFLFDSLKRIELIKVIIGLLILVFALVELIPNLEKKFVLDRKYLPFGGLISGFFGGLSGHQGALRSAFLIKMNLTKETFIATGIVIALLIDVTRISVYSQNLLTELLYTNYVVLIAATLAAFLGAFLGRIYLHKITYRTIKIIVGILLVFISIGLMTGVI
jgi:uncharacterized protein